MNLARLGNKYLADTEPWKLAKTDLDRVATILNISLQITANLALAFAPFLPMSSDRLSAMLQLSLPRWEDLGRSDLLPVGHQLGEVSLLFEKIEDEVIEKQVQKLLKTKEANEAAEAKASAVAPDIASSVLRCPRRISSSSSVSMMASVVAPLSLVSLSTMLPRIFSASRFVSLPTFLPVSSRV